MWMSFTNYQFVLPQATRFIGLGNYIEAVKDPSVRHGFVVAGVFTVLNYLGAFLFPLLVALVLDRVRNPRIGTLYRVLLYIPAVMPAPLIYRLWAWIFAPSLGLLNYAGYSLLGVFPRQFNWLRNAVTGEVVYRRLRACRRQHVQRPETGFWELLDCGSAPASVSCRLAISTRLRGSWIT